MKAEYRPIRYIAACTLRLTRVISLFRSRNSGKRYERKKGTRDLLPVGIPCLRLFKIFGDHLDLPFLASTISTSEFSIKVTPSLHNGKILETESAWRLKKAPATAFGPFRIFRRVCFNFCHWSNNKKKSIADIVQQNGVDRPSQYTSISGRKRRENGSTFIISKDKQCTSLVFRGHHIPGGSVYTACALCSPESKASGDRQFYR
jgi:hypothetical protein